MFSTAKVINPVAAKSSSGKDRAEFQMSGLEQLAQVDALIKSLEGIKGTLDADVKAQALELFIEHANGKRPESFRGLEGTASASVELRKRATTSPLTPEQQVLLAAAGIKGEKVITTNKMFGINPKYAEDNSLLAKVEAALAGIVPTDFIVLQEEKSKIVVTDQAIDAVFKADEADRALVETVCVLAIKPKLESTDIGSIIDNVRAFLVPKANPLAKAIEAVKA